MPKTQLTLVLETERASINQQLGQLEKRRQKINELLNDYGHKGSVSNRKVRTKGNAARKQGSLSNMDMVRQILKGTKKD